MFEVPIKSLSIHKDGRLILELINGERFMPDLMFIDAVTSATLHEGYVVATDGARIIRFDGSSVEDITAHFVRA